VNEPLQWEHAWVPVHVAAVSHAQPATVHVAFVFKPAHAEVAGELTTVASVSHVAAAAAAFAEKAQPVGQLTLGHAGVPEHACVFHEQPLIAQVVAVRSAQLAVVGPCLSASATAKVQPFACAQVAAVHFAAVHVPGVSRARQAS